MEAHFEEAVVYSSILGSVHVKPKRAFSLAPLHNCGEYQVLRWTRILGRKRHQTVDEQFIISPLLIRTSYSH